MVREGQQRSESAGDVSGVTREVLIGLSLSYPIDSECLAESVCEQQVGVIGSEIESQNSVLGSPECDASTPNYP